MASLLPRAGGGGNLLIINHAALAAMNVPGGMTWKFTTRIVREVEVDAKSRLLPGRGLRTGELRRSVQHSTTPVPGGVVGHVRATAKHAILYHDGFRPHVIHANHVSSNPSKEAALEFRLYHGLGAPMYRAKVNHPGFRGHPFLSDAMHWVLAAHGIAR